MEKRTELTRQLIADSFKALMLRHPFEKISILMIANEAGIRRPSFYNHFQDKYDLLTWIVDTEVIAPAEEPLRAGDRREALHRLFTQLADNALFYRRAFTVNGQNGFEGSFILRMRELLLRSVPISGGVSELLPPSDVAHFHAVCFVSVVRSWLESGKSISPEELTDAYLYLVTHSVWAS